MEKRGECVRKFVEHREDFLGEKTTGRLTFAGIDGVLENIRPMHNNSYF